MFSYHNKHSKWLVKVFSFIVLISNSGSWMRNTNHPISRVVMCRSAPWGSLPRVCKVCFACLASSDSGGIKMRCPWAPDRKVLEVPQKDVFEIYHMSIYVPYIFHTCSMYFPLYIYICSNMFHMFHIYIYIIYSPHMFHYESASLVGIREGLFFFCNFGLHLFCMAGSFCMFFVAFFCKLGGAPWKQRIHLRILFLHFFRIFVCKFKAPPWKVSKT